MRGGMYKIMKRNIAFFILVLFCVMLVGCGETVNGIGKDVSRVGKGIKTIFIKDAE